MFEPMKVLIGCEYSGIVRDAFIERGHNAISCDLLPTEKPGPHYQGDVSTMLHDWWDLIIMHPPCTALTVAGNRTYGEDKPKYWQRLDSAKWTENLWLKSKKAAKKVCFENPKSVLARLTCLPKANYVQPYWFGHPEQKLTGLHLHGLDPLEPTNNVYEIMMRLPKRERERVFHLPPTHDRWKLRSTTFQGVADAMASQWG